ncbi:MAG TPA: isoprenylcysteine carboxylmethyltransferase family protein [Streptosporangiaceae bacterium]|nr:isoprenylcysteine carboxylmethyltransferase family protein [Streptosporangiaceae bacterium]
MKPYFLTHPVGILYLLVMLSWYLMEGVQFARQQEWRQEAARISPRGFWPAYWACVAAATTMLILAPHIAPAAAIGHGAAVFALGMVLLVAGIALRLWSFHALGRYFTFTFTVKISPGQPVVSNGPYRVLRHPGYAGGLLAIAAVGLLNGNWVGLASVVLPWLVLIVWRIRVEENALLTALDGRYRAYAAHHKRLVPLVW